MSDWSKTLKPELTLKVSKQNKNCLGLMENEQYITNQKKKVFEKFEKKSQFE